MISIPFSGSKRYSYKNVKKIVEEGGYKRVYEPFGGSCVLSVNLVNDGVVEQAIANDYDHFFDDYPEYLDLKDKVVAECYRRGLKKVCSDKEGSYFINDNGEKVRLKQLSLSEEPRKILQKVISTYVPKELYPYFCLGTQFGWHTRLKNDEIKLNNFKLFSRDLTTTKQRKYIELLKKVKLENLDYKDFIEIYKWDIQDDPDVLLIIDPPYIDNETSQYKGGFSISQENELIELLRDLNVDFVFFESNQDFVSKLQDIFEEELIIDEKEILSGLHTTRKDVLTYIKRNRG